jgi:mannose/cellobiose epimerase-like protein (N-acyl-D-glucosamine 2-epimerase family)
MGVCPHRLPSRRPSRRIVGLASLGVACLAWAAPASGQEHSAASLGTRPGAEQPELRASRATLEHILTGNILPFWYPEVLDRENGGYRLNHSVEGQWRGPAPKFLITQARTVWFFAHLARSPYGKPEHLEAARHGFQFLRDRMWDSEHGGFFWEVDASGRVPTRPHKHLYAQAFGLYALSEFALASHDAQAEQLARRLFALIERAHDAHLGGYREFFARDWGPAPDVGGEYMGASPAGTKLMNTHLHLLEALTTYVRLTQEAQARERLLELIEIESSTVVRKEVAACTDQYAADWTPRNTERVSYGHDIENVWLVMDARDALGLPQAPLTDLYRALFENALRYGYDVEQGGFYTGGLLGKPADRKEKVWWPQSEGLIAALSLYRLTGDERYRSTYLGTLKWIESRQVDWEHGDWHETILPDGRPAGLKAAAWKGPYHDGRAMLRSLEILTEMGVR